MTEMTRERDPYDLFMGYIDVVNKALKEHSDTPLVGEVLSLMTRLGEGRKFGAAIYKTDPEKPFDYFTVRLADGKVELDARGKREPDIAFRVSQDFLVKVNENPEDYVANPARLDIDWLKSRLKSW